MKLKSFLGLAAGCLYLCAADAWSSRQPAEWSQADVRKILNDSPWARQVAVTFLGRAPGEGLPQGGGGRGGRGGRGGGSGGAGGGIEGAEGHQRPEVNVTVRWESAAPVQLAEKHLPTEETALPPDQYVIVVAGLPMRGTAGPQTQQQFQFQESAGLNRGRRDPAAVRAELLERTELLRKGKPAIHPSDLQTESTGVRQIRFLFPRGTDPISLDDKEVIFTTQIGMMKIEKRFRVKDMTFQGKLEL